MSALLLELSDGATVIWATLFIIRCQAAEALSPLRLRSGHFDSAQVAPARLTADGFA